MKHKKGCTSGWDGSCVLGCPFHPRTSRLGNVREASGVESKFVEAADERRWKALKFVSPGLRGVPDRMVLKGLDRAVDAYMQNVWAPTEVERREIAQQHVRDLLALVIEFAELKAPDKDATMEQMRVHEKFRKLGFAVSVIDSPTAVEKWYADRS